MTFDHNLSKLALWAVSAVCEVCWDLTQGDLEVVETGTADLTIMCLTCWHDYLDECRLEG
jgi:hypothetical protein